MEPSRPGPAKRGPSCSTSAGTSAPPSCTRRRHLAGSEIEIRREGAAWDGTHVAVRARRIPGGEVHAALFPALEQGSYEVRVRGDDERARAAVAVEGARVSEARLAP